MRPALLCVILLFGCNLAEIREERRADRFDDEEEECFEEALDACIEAGGSEDECAERARFCEDDEREDFEERSLAADCDVRCGGLAEGVALGCTQAGGGEEFCEGEAAIAFEFCQYGCGVCGADEVREERGEEEEGEEGEEEEGEA